MKEMMLMVGNTCLKMAKGLEIMEKNLMQKCVIERPGGNGLMN